MRAISPDGRSALRAGNGGPDLHPYVHALASVAAAVFAPPRPS